MSVKRYTLRSIYKALSSGQDLEMPDCDVIAETDYDALAAMLKQQDGELNQAADELAEKQASIRALEAGIELYKVELAVANEGWLAADKLKLDAQNQLSAELALRQSAEGYAARNALRVIAVEAALRDLLDDLSEDVGQRHHRDKYRVYQVGPQTIEAARALLPALETACTCDSTLVTDISNHQPHCPRYVAETKGDAGG